jgi:hypothetical protein
MRLLCNEGRLAPPRAVGALSGALLLSLCALIPTGCGTPGAPQPPSLHLPQRVTDLSASRDGDQVTLTWTIPKRNTDKILLKDPIEARICRREDAGACAAAGNAQFAPGADARFSETLPAALCSGAPRTLTYFVELVDTRRQAHGRSAGLSNGAVIAAGAAPAAVDGLSAQMRRDGVLLAWAPASGDTSTAVRLERTLLTPPARSEQKNDASPLAPPPEAAEQKLLVASGGQPGRALDRSIHFGESYAYRAERVAQVTVGGEKLELDGPLSAPVRIDALQEFPPAVPTGVAAVATAAENGAPAAIDLSWQANSETDFAGYAVYRRDVTATGEAGASGQDAWARVSGAQPVVGPGFHDGNVQAGHTYAYAVSAIDQEGHESARSAEAQETVPGS